MGELILFVLFALIIVINAVVGLIRGLNKSVIRIMFVAVAVLLTYLLAGPITTAVANGLTYEGQPLGEVILESVNADSSMSALFASSPLLRELILVAPAFIVGIIVFPVMFGVIKFLTWIGFLFAQKPLRQLIFKENRTKAEYKELPKKDRLINRFSGLGVGIAIGMIVFGMIVTPIFGVFGMLPSADAMNGVMDTLVQQESMAASDAEVVKDLYATTDSGLVNFYGFFGTKAAGKAYLNSVTKVEVDGVKTSLGAEIGTLMDMVQTVLQSKLMDVLENPEAIGELIQDKETLSDLMRTAFRSEVLSDAMPGMLATAMGVPEELSGAAGQVFGTMREELMKLDEETYNKEVDAVVSLCTEFTSGASENAVVSLFEHAEQSDVIYNTLVGISDSNILGIESIDAAETQQIANAITAAYEQTGKTERDQGTATALAAILGLTGFSAG